MQQYILDPFKYARLSKVEKQRYDKYRARFPLVDERDEPLHPNRTDSGRRAMRALVRYRNKKATGRYGG